MAGTEAFWSRNADQLSRELGSHGLGLSQSEADRRLKVFGPNDIEKDTLPTALRLLLRQFESPLVLILLFGALVSLSLREWIDASIIIAIVLGSTLLGFVQEYRASAAIKDLRRRISLTCRVVRDGATATISVRDVVPGDVVQLSAGNLVPADGLILEAKDFLVAEAGLTGESFPVEKRPGIVGEDAPPAARTNAVFLGSSVRSGTARALIVHTGAKTAFGAIAVSLADAAPQTEFVRGVNEFGAMLMRVMIFMVLFVLTVDQLLGRPFVDSLLFAVALAVGLSPELLPAIVSVTLSAGARTMAKSGVIVRRLEAIEDLGSIDVLCTDKTGTLTEGVIVLEDAIDEAGNSSSRVRELVYLNAALETGIDNPLDAAIVAMGEAQGFSAVNVRKIDEIPYDFRRRRLTIVVAEAGDEALHTMITKGAVDNVLSICSRADDGGALTEERRGKLQAMFEARSKAGYRVLAVATRRVPARAQYGQDDEAEFGFAGFLLFADPPKAGVTAAIGDLARLGIGIKVISGDNRFVTAHLADAIGLPHTAMLTGEQLTALKDEALWHLAPRTDLFVEVDPQQKERIVRALQHTGHAVGFLGDGINDAPALHASDVGISVDKAVDVARESADVILLSRDLDVLRRGVEDGRRTFANTLKYIAITTSANFGNMISMALASPFLPFMPLLPKQILLNNFLSDGPSMTIATDNVDREHLTVAQRWNIKEVQRFMIAFGLTSSLFDLMTFAVLLLVFHADAPTFQTTWFLVSLITELSVVLILRTRYAAWTSRPSRLLLWSSAIIALICLGLPYSGGIARLFGFVQLPASLFLASLAIVAGYIGATEALKRWYYRSTN